MPVSVPAGRMAGNEGRKHCSGSSTEREGSPVRHCRTFSPHSKRLFLLRGMTVRSLVEASSAVILHENCELCNFHPGSTILWGCAAGGALISCNGRCAGPHPAARAKHGLTGCQQSVSGAAPSRLRSCLKRSFEWSTQPGAARPIQLNIINKNCKIIFIYYILFCWAAVLMAS